MKQLEQRGAGEEGVNKETRGEMTQTETFAFILSVGPGFSQVDFGYI